MCLQNFALAAGIEVFSPVSHTLFNPTDIIHKVSLNLQQIDLILRMNSFFLYGWIPRLFIVIIVLIMLTCDQFVLCSC